MVPKIQAFIHEPYLGAWYCNVRPLVAPRANQPPKVLVLLDHSENSVGVHVMPSSDQQHWYFDSAVVFAYGPMLPEVIVSLEKKMLLNSVDMGGATIPISILNN